MTPDMYEVARQESWRYRVSGYTREDLEQEALAAMLAARHNPAQGPLRPFLRLVARRTLLSLLQASRRAHHAALNEAGHAAEDSYLRAPAAESHDARQRLQTALARLGELSLLERRALVGLTIGCTYHELGGNQRTVDNAVQRARRKLAA